MKKTTPTSSSSKNSQKKHIGNSGEDYCVQQLEKEGYEILERNFCCRYGEIDIIARDGHFLVFIEVKTRTKDTIDHTKCDITYSKQKKITRTAMVFLATYHNPEILEYRFDVIICLADTLPCHPSQGGNEGGLSFSERTSAFPTVTERTSELVTDKRKSEISATDMRKEVNNSIQITLNHFKNAFPPAEVGDFFA